jgi:hypothetical protein
VCLTLGAHPTSSSETAKFAWAFPVKVKPLQRGKRGKMELVHKKPRGCTRFSFSSNTHRITNLPKLAKFIHGTWRVHFAVQRMNASIDDRLPGAGRRFRRLFDLNLKIRALANSAKYCDRLTKGPQDCCTGYVNLFAGSVGTSTGSPQNSAAAVRTNFGESRPDGA